MSGPVAKGIRRQPRPDPPLERSIPPSKQRIQRGISASGEQHLLPVMSVRTIAQKYMELCGTVSFEQARRGGQEQPRVPKLAGKLVVGLAATRRRDTH